MKCLHFNFTVSKENNLLLCVREREEERLTGWLIDQQIKRLKKTLCVCVCVFVQKREKKDRKRKTERER